MRKLFLLFLLVFIGFAHSANASTSGTFASDVEYLLEEGIIDNKADYQDPDKIVQKDEFIVFLVNTFFTKTELDQKDRERSTTYFNGEYYERTPFKEDILYAHYRGVLSAKPGGIVLDRNLSRAEFYKLILDFYEHFSVSKADVSQIVDRFDHIDPEQWYTPYVAFLIQHRLIKLEQHKNIDAPVTLSEFVELLAKINQLEENYDFYQTISFEDYEITAHKGFFGESKPIFIADLDSHPIDIVAEMYWPEEYGVLGFTYAFKASTKQNLTVGNVFPHSAAEKAGLQKNDKIYAIDGVRASKLYSEDYSIVKKALEGKPGTKVNIVARDFFGNLKSVDVVREASNINRLIWKNHSNYELLNFDENNINQGYYLYRIFGYETPNLFLILTPEGAIILPFGSIENERVSRFFRNHLNHIKVTNINSKKGDSQHIAFKTRRSIELSEWVTNKHFAPQLEFQYPQEFIQIRSAYRSPSFPKTFNSDDNYCNYRQEKAFFLKMNNPMLCIIYFADTTFINEEEVHPTVILKHLYEPGWEFFIDFSYQRIINSIRLDTE